MEKDGFLGDFLNLNWDQPQQQQQQHSDLQTSNFESAMSSIVSSPTSSSLNLAAAANSAAPENTVIRELIGRLGSICNNGNSDVLSPPDNSNVNNSQYHSGSTSCYTTPLNSPPKLNLSMSTAQFPFGTDPGFAERAARFSCFGQLGVNSGNLMASNAGAMQMQQHMNGSPVMMMRASAQGEASSPVVNNHVATRKRKSNATTPSTSSSSKGSKGKDASKASIDEKLNAKRCKAEAAADAAAIVKAEQNNNESTGKKSEEKQASEPPKQDYIHVRARRGQATDSHSLAERVRREKISERMKFLQDLVPGCNKVTGKAVMLDEIINYVQSLQRQVEFLSMKLATVNPRADISVESLFHKDAHQTHGVIAPNSSTYPMDAASIAAFTYANQPHDHAHQSLQTLMESQLLDAGLGRSLSMQLPSLDGFTDASSASQLGAFWEDDLQSVVQMGFGQNQEPMFPPQNLQGQVSTGNMKIEL